MQTGDPTKADAVDLRPETQEQMVHIPDGVGGSGNLGRRRLRFNGKNGFLSRLYLATPAAQQVTPTCFGGGQLLYSVSKVKQ